MTHTITYSTFKANENGQGSLAGHKATCSCGWDITNSLNQYEVAKDAAAHTRYMAAKEAKASLRKVA